MLDYRMFNARVEMLRPWRAVAGTTAAMLRQFELGSRPNPLLRPLISTCEMLVHTQVTGARPSFGVSSVLVGNSLVPVTETYVDSTAFGRLLHFRKASDVVQPKVLIVAPMSGHFATLLAGTVKVMLPDNDVYITDWQNARDIPVSAGEFGLEDYIDHLIRFIRVLGPGSHVVGVCQPAVPVLAAVAVMAEDGDAATPRSMTLMAGPVDARISPTRVNILAMAHPLDWFRKELIDTVPWPLPGAGRAVYPGFVQLTAFVSMNLDRHLGAHLTQFRNLVGGNGPEVEAHNSFYDEYLAVMDLPAEFFLQTVRCIFQEHELAQGTMTHRGRKVDPAAIRNTAILTVEGERDDICGLGQTMAALDMCSNVPTSMKSFHLQTGVGHYGVFSGRRWATEIYPRLRTLIASATV